MRRIVQISAAVVAVLLVAMVFHAWLATHDEQMRMQAVIKTQAEQIAAADAREHDRAIALDQTLAAIDKSKRETQTPQQILADLPKYLPLPQSITMDQTGESNPATGAGTTANEKGSRVSSKSGPPRLMSSLAGKFDSVRRVLGGRASIGVNARSKDVPGVSRDHEDAGARATRPAGSQAEESARDESISGPEESAGSIGTSQRSMRDGAETVPPKGAGRDKAANKNSDRELPDDPSHSTNSSRTTPSATDNPASAIEQPNGKPSAVETARPNASGGDPASASAEIPAADLKPLFDYAQDCRACQASLSAAKQNRLDDAAKLAGLTRERDAAVTAAKGGTLWRRFRRNAAWLIIGAATATAVATAITAQHPSIK